MKLYIGILILISFVPRFLKAQTYTIISENNKPVTEFCKSELNYFLNRKNGFEYKAQARMADWEIILKQNPALQECSFAIKSYSKNKKQYIELTGATDRDIPCAVYTLLEKMGYTFDISGYTLTGKINTGAVKDYSEIIIPKTKYRGIRQHLNFPMDISSYSLRDAKQYILNLVRMRFNFIAFHSYPGQWYEIREKDTTKYAGHFFYGDRYDMPNNKLIRQHVHNKKVFCIPEIEPFYDNVAKRSQMSVDWLEELMGEAKRMGMKIEFSFEPRSKSLDVKETLNELQQIYQQYPKADVIEMITEESGGWGPRNTAEETKNILTSFFGSEILNDTILTKPIKPIQSDLGYLYTQIGHVIETMKAAKQQHLKLPSLKLGIYCTNQYNVAAYHLAKKFLPAKDISIMPGHGSIDVAQKTPRIFTQKSDWGNTTIYSWLEFDGMMFLQQNGIDGIYELLKKGQGSDSSFQFNTIAFNHWRTAENKITARYAAIATLFGEEDPKAFYINYAEKIGIASPKTFSNGMLLLQKAYNANISNMGFAWMGAWSHGFRFHPDSVAKDMLSKYQAARNELDKCNKCNHTKNATNTILFLDNRLRTTIIYIQAFIKANELTVPGITNESYNRISDDVLSIFYECMKVYAEQLPDRGCEGTLIDLYYCPVRGIKIARYKKTGMLMNEPLKPSSHFDAPAPPIFKGGD